MSDLDFDSRENDFMYNKIYLSGHDIIATHPSRVKQYTPFRYPGGKSWLTPQINVWLSQANFTTLVEPFAGGSSVGLYALMDGLVDNIIINEIDADVYNFWKVVKNNSRSLAQMVLDFRPDELEARKIITDHKFSNLHASGSLDWAFITLLRNRLARNGVMTKRSGVLKKGDRGLFSRWYPETLANRILKIGDFADGILLSNCDGTEIIKKRKGVAYFIDPPYNVAGKVLYNHSSVDHDEIIKRLSNLGHTGLATYDSHMYILGLVFKYGLDHTRIAMKGGMNTFKTELIISKNLEWLKGQK